MRRTLSFLAVAAFLCTVPAMAKPTFVKGAKCTACHEGTPKDKKFNAATTKMLAKYKVEQCKDCHGAEGGKLTIIKKK